MSRAGDRRFQANGISTVWALFVEARWDTRFLRYLLWIEKYKSDCPTFWLLSLEGKKVTVPSSAPLSAHYALRVAVLALGFFMLP
jgi:hypothetical protein